MNNNISLSINCKKEIPYNDKGISFIYLSYIVRAKPALSVHVSALALLFYCHCINGVLEAIFFIRFD